MNNAISTRFYLLLKREGRSAKVASLHLSDPSTSLSDQDRQRLTQANWKVVGPLPCNLYLANDQSEVQEAVDELLRGE